MKITSVDILKIDSKLGEPFCPIITRVHTDEGIYGLGEAGMAILNGYNAVYAALKAMAASLIGRDPRDINVIWDELFENAYGGARGGPVVMSAISALDTSLWDIKAKSMGVPLYQALGGAFRDRIHAYASQLHFSWGGQKFNRIGDIGAYRASVEAAKAQGYDAVKVNFLAMDGEGRTNPLHTLKNMLDRELLHQADLRMQVVREVMGEKGIIVAENNANTDVNTALEFARVAEPYHIAYLEEPCLALSAEGYRKIADGTTIPLAGGERIFTRWGFLPFLENGSLSVAQPDVGNCGGVTEFMRIASLAEYYNASIQSHACNSPISVAIALHTEAAIGNFILHEHHITNTFDWVRRLCVYDYQPIDGYIPVPQLPGIGQDLSEYALAHAEVTTVS